MTKQLVFASLIYTFFSYSTTLENKRHQSTAYAGKDTVLICRNNYQLQANALDVDEVGIWSIFSGTGTLLNNTSNDAIITLMGIGSVALVWQVTNTITSAFTEDYILITNVVPTLATTNVGTITCTNLARITGNVPTYGTGIWTVESGSGNFLNKNAAITTVTGLGIGTNVFKWTISGGVCTSNATVSIHFNKAIAGNNQTLCGTNTSLNALPSSVNSGVWTLRSPITGNPATEPNVEDDNDTLSVVTNIMPGKNIFRWTTRNFSPNSCVSFAEVTISGDSINKANAGTDVIICADSIVLTGNLPIQGLGTWTILTSTSAVIIPINCCNSKIKLLNEGLNVLEWKLQKGNCITKDTIIVQNDKPSKAVVMADIQLCANNVTISANTPTQGIGNWYTISGAATIANANTNNANITNLSAGIVLLGWQTNYGNCPASKDTLKITSGVFAQAYAGIDRQICGDTVRLAANSVAGIGNWRVISGTGVVLNPTAYNSKVSNITVNGTLALEWQFAISGCAITKDTIYIQRDFATPANAGVNQIICTNTGVLTANTPLFGKGIWSFISGSGTISNNLAANTLISNLGTGINILQWAINTTFCGSVSTVSINFNKANAGLNQEICEDLGQLDASEPSVNSGAWTLRFPNTGDTFADPMITDENDETSYVINLKPGKNIFRWTTRNVGPNSCSSFAEVTITNNAINVADVGSDKIMCADSMILTGNVPTQGLGTWTILTSTSAVISNPNVYNSKVKLLNEGLNMLEWKIEKGICNSKDTLTIQNDNPSKALVVNDLSICTATTTITAIAPTQGTGNWFNISGNGLIDNVNANNTSISGLSAGAITLGWKTSFGSCPSKFDTLRITRFISIQSNAGIDKQICGDSLVLDGNSITGNGLWRIITGSGVVLNPQNYNSKIKNITVNGITKLEWEFRTPGCSITKDTVEITRDFVSQAQAGANQISCVDFVTLAANAPQFGSGSWSIITGGGTFDNTTIANTSISGLLPNINIFKWQIDATYCSSSSLVTITSNMPTKAIARTDKIICASSDTLKSNTVFQGNATWQLLTGTGTIFTPNNNNSLVNNLGFGNNIFRITITKAACISRDTLVLNNNLPDFAATGNDTILCVDQMQSFANTPLQGTGQWIVTQGAISISNIFNPRATFTGIGGGQNNAVWSVTSGLCNANRDTLKVYNYSVIKPTTSGTNCIILTTNTSASIVLNASNLNFGESATWAIFPNGNYGFAPNSTAANITVSGVTRGFFRAIRDVFDSYGGTCRAKDTVLISVIPKSIPATDQCIRAGVGIITLTSNLTSLNTLNVSIGENGFWSFENSISGNTPFPTINTSSGAALGMRKGVHVFAYTTRNNNLQNCVSKENIKVTILTEAEAGPNQCIKDVSEQTAFVPNVGNPINPVVGGQFIWSAAGPAQINPSTGTTNNLVLGRNKFYLTNFNTNSSCSNIDSVFVTLVTNPDAGSDSSLVASQSTNYANSFLVAKAPSTLVGETASWSIANTGASSSSPDAILGSFTNPNTQVQNLISGVNIFVWQINNLANGCSFRDTVYRNVISQARVNASFYVTNPNPTVPLSFTLSALNTAPNSLRVARGEIGTWELVDFLAVNAPNSTLGTNPNTIQLSDVRRGVFNFKWTISNVSFPGFVSTANISITVLTKAKAGNPYCINSINNLDLGNAPSIPIRQLSSERYYWTSNNASVFINQIDKTLQTSTDNVPLATISNIPIGKTKMYLHIQNITSGFEDVDSLQITKTTKADIGLDAEICVNSVQMAVALSPNAMVGESFSWQRISGKGTFDTDILQPMVIGLDTGKNVFRFEILNSGCKNGDTITVANIGTYLATIGGVPISCFTANYFDGNNPKLQFPTATGKWNLLAQPVFSNAILVDNTVARLQVNDMIRTGTYKFNYVVSNKFCTITSDTFFVQRQNSIFGSAGPNVSICKDKYIMQGSYPSIVGVSGEWTLNGGGGDINGINNKNATITGIPNDEIGFQNIFQWKVTLGECSSTYNVIITNFSPPTTASILGLNTLSFCEKDTLKLSSYYTPGLFIGTSKWKSLQGNIKFDTTTLKYSNLTFLGFGTHKISYEISNSAFCPTSTDSITIFRYKKPTLSLAGINQKICADTIQLRAQTPEVGAGLWSITTANSPIAIQFPNVPSNKITNVQPGDYNFKWKITNGTCKDSSFVNFKVRSQISAPIATRISPQCDTSTFAISGNTPTLGTNVWRGPFVVTNNTITSRLVANSKIKDSLATNTSLQLKDIGKSALIYVIKDDFCILSDTVYIDSYHAPSPIKIQKDTISCTDSLLIKVDLPQFGTSHWVINTINGVNIFSQNPTQLGLALLPHGVTTFIYSIRQTACPANVQIVTVTNYKLETAFAGNDTLICSPTLQLKAKTPQYDKGNWQIITGNGTFINSDNTLPTAIISNISQGTNVLKWTLNNEKCPIIDDIITITNNKIAPLAPLEKQTVFSVNVNIEAPKPNFGNASWSIVKSSAIIENAFSNSTSVKGLDVGENIFRWTVSIAGCSSESTELIVKLNDIIVPQLISPNDDTINQTFEIFGLDKYPNATLEIFNKWGKSVYRNNNYDNTWAGQNNDLQPLVDDTYTYILTANDGKVIKKDFITIKR